MVAGLRRGRQVVSSVIGEGIPRVHHVGRSARSFGIFRNRKFSEVFAAQAAALRGWHSTASLLWLGQRPKSTRAEAGGGARERPAGVGGTARRLGLLSELRKTGKQVELVEPAQQEIFAKPRRRSPPASRPTSCAATSVMHGGSHHRRNQRGRRVRGQPSGLATGPARRSGARRHVLAQRL
jgi:hypothetical protein